MAIELAITTTSGIDLPNAYIRVAGFLGDKTYVSYTARTWASASARTAEKDILEESNYSFAYSKTMGEIMAACYKDLMSRPEYAGATSV